jgi:hypothetical protein
MPIRLPFFTVFHLVFRDDEHAGTQLGNGYFPFPAQVTHFLFPGTRIDLEERVWCKYSNEPYDIVIKRYYG